MCSAQLSSSILSYNYSNTHTHKHTKLNWKHKLQTGGRLQFQWSVSGCWKYFSHSTHTTVTFNHAQYMTVLAKLEMLSFEAAPTTLALDISDVHIHAGINSIASLHFVKLQPPAAIAALKMFPPVNIFTSCQCELWHMTVNFKLDLDMVKVNHSARNLGQRSFLQNL